MLTQAYVQVYTGNGKGKTTASLGVALRILGSGGKVFYAQFIKGKTISSEFTILKTFPAFSYKSFGKGRFIKGQPVIEDIKLAQAGLKECTEAASSGNYDLVVMDELNAALTCSLVSLNDVKKIINLRNSQTELIITGRNAHKDIIESADLVTEMMQIKHYFEKGVPARTGIEK